MENNFFKFSKLYYEQPYIIKYYDNKRGLYLEHDISIIYPFYDTPIFNKLQLYALRVHSYVILDM